jgi:hypothetical protein
VAYRLTILSSNGKANTRVYVEGKKERKKIRQKRRDNYIENS